MRKTHLLIVMLLAVTLFTVMLSKGYAAYNSNDSTRLANFLNQQSAVAGQTNAQMLDVVANNPATWDFAEWTDNTPKRILAIRVPNSNLAGSLNLQGCDSLTVLDFSQNSISQLNVISCNKLDTLKFSNNLLQNVDLTGCISLRYLDCDDNNIAQLTITSCVNLQNLKCRNNNLVFSALLLPTSIPNDAEYLIGMQKPYRPDEVVVYSNRSESKGFVIDLTKLGASVIEWKFAGGISVPLANFEREGDKFAFDETLNGSKIYADMWSNTTNMRVVTVEFNLSYNYNQNDLTKLLNFLNQPSAKPDTINGRAINPHYILNDPVSSNTKVTWGVRKDGDNPREYHLIEFWNEWTNAQIAGNLDLSGAKFLVSVDVRDNNLTQLNLNDATSLTHIYAHNNDLTQLSLLRTTALTHIEIYHNKLESFNFSAITNVKYFDFSNNKVSQINLEPHRNLLYLLCNNNLLEKLDISKNADLLHLLCNNNKLDELKIVNTLKLRRLECKNNNLTELNLSGLAQLELAILNNNKLEKLGTEKLIQLEHLEANDNFIDSINLETALNLKTLKVSNNELTYLNLAGLSRVTHFHCENNKLNLKTLLMPNVNIANYTELYLHPQDTVARELFIRIGDEYVSKEMKINLSAYANIGTTFTWKNADGNIIATTNNPVFVVPDLYDGKTIYCELTNATTHPNLTLTTPRFRANYKYNEHDVAKLRTFLDSDSKFGNSANGRENGKEIYADYYTNDPATFPVIWKVVEGEKRLYQIDWSNASNDPRINTERVSNLKGTLDLKGCIALYSINLTCENNVRRNAITSLLLDGCADLSVVKAQYNQLATVNVKDCFVLDTLDFSHNVIASEFVIESKNILRYLDISNNKINATNPKFDGYFELKVLNISNNNFTGALNLTGNNALVNLDFSYNKFNSVNLTSNVNITKLNGSYNSLTNINLANQKYLKELNVDSNRLTALNISNNKELASLSCRYNSIEELDFEGVDYVTHLYATHNKLVFASIKYETTPNEVSLHPQAEVPISLDADGVIFDGTLDLSWAGEVENTVTIYTVKYLNGNIVPSHLYNLEAGIFTNFSDELKGRTLYCEMTNSHFPGLTLTTVRFNTAPPDRYNANDSMRLRTFLDSPSKINGFSNGQYLSFAISNLPNYEPENPATYFVEWKNINGENRVTFINWHAKSELSGKLILTDCEYLDTLVVGGNNSNNTAITGLILDGCVSIKYLDCSRNNITNLNLNNLTTISYLDCSHNALTFASLVFTVKPTEFYFNPQALVVPDYMEGDLYSYIFVRDTIDLSVFGADIYELYLADGTPLGQWIAGDGKIDLKEFDGQTVYFEMTSMQNKFANCTLQTVRFKIDLWSNVAEKEPFGNINIHPNPVIDEANIVLNTHRDGNLNVAIYDLSGSFMMNVISDRFVNANTELRIPLSLGMLPSGTYTVMISMNNNIMMRQVIVVR